MSHDLTTRTFSITPTQALHWLEEYKHGGQRGLSQELVTIYAGEMKAGKFTTNTIVLAQLPDGGKFLVNGQHTLWAIAEAKVTLTLPVATVQAQDEDDLALLYSTQDIGRGRGPADAFAPYRLEEKLNLKDFYLTRLYSAVRIIRHNFVRPRGREPLHQYVEAMTAWAPQAHHFIELVNGSPLGMRMLRRDLFSIGLFTLNLVHTPSPGDFWRNAARDDGLSLGDPAKALNKWIIESFAYGGNRPSGQTLDYQLHAIATCWNAYYTGRPLRLIRVANPRAIVRLAGTPQGK